MNGHMPNIRQYCQPSFVALTLPVTVILSIWDSMANEAKQPPPISKKKRQNATVRDTALGRHQETSRRHLIASIRTISQEEMERVEQEILRVKAAAAMVKLSEGDGRISDGDDGGISYAGGF